MIDPSVNLAVFRRSAKLPAIVLVLVDVFLKRGLSHVEHWRIPIEGLFRSQPSRVREDWHQCGGRYGAELDRLERFAVTVTTCEVGDSRLALGRTEPSRHL